MFRSDRAALRSIVLELYTQGFPDVAGRTGEAIERMRALEEIETELQPIWEALAQCGEHRLQALERAVSDWRMREMERRWPGSTR